MGFSVNCDVACSIFVSWQLLDLQRGEDGGISVQSRSVICRVHIIRRALRLCFDGTSFKPSPFGLLIMANILQYDGGGAVLWHNPS